MMDPALPHPALAPGVWPAAPAVDTPEARDALDCPLCGYSLRGLAVAVPREPRCPECGYAFDWVKLLHARQFSHPYLFEHHPRHNLWSFARTLLAGLRPARFWSSLNAGHDLRPGRLMLYWLATAIGLAASNILGGWLIALQFPDNRPPRTAVELSFFQVSDLEFSLAFVGLFWPWLSLLALLVFQASMRRARLRVGHLLRCVVYSSDVFLWTGLAAFFIYACGEWLRLGAGFDQALRAQQAALVALLTIAAATYRLVAAYRKYLHFDHATLTVAASQVVVFLALVTAFAMGARQFWWLFRYR